MRSHWPRPELEPTPIRITLCGDFAPPLELALVREGVTCKKCAAKIAPPDRAERYTAAAFQRSADPTALEPLIDPELGLPLLGPSTWRRRGCACGSCGVCRWFLAIYRDQWAAPWRPPTETQLDPRWRWGSVRAALAWFADELEDGIGTPSGMRWSSTIGRVAPERGERLAVHIARCLALLPRSPFPEANSAALEDADVRALLELELRRLYDDRPPGPARSLELLLLRLAGRRELHKAPNGSAVTVRVPVPATLLGAELGMSRGEVGAIVRRGVAVLASRLAARGLIPPPRG